MDEPTSAAIDHLGADSSSGVAVRHAHVERVPVERVAGVMTDAGTLPGEMVEEACRAASVAVGERLLERWLATRPCVP